MRYHSRLLEKAVKAEIEAVSAGSRWPIKWEYVNDPQPEQQVFGSIEGETLRLIIIPGGLPR